MDQIRSIQEVMIFGGARGDFLLTKLCQTNYQPSAWAKFLDAKRPVQIFLCQGKKHQPSYLVFSEDLLQLFQANGLQIPLNIIGVPFRG